MISLHPHRSTEPFAPLGAVSAEQRQTDDTGPWVMTNMISSADGATAIDGLSGSLGGPADAEMFTALRSVADAIIVGADTVRAERYRRPGIGSPEARAARAARGQQERPIIVIVTASAALDPSLPLFESSDYRPWVFTSAQAPAERRRELSAVAEVVVLGEERVGLADAVAEVGRRGLSVLLSEGGPTLNGQLVADDLIDEWNLTISPILAGGDSRRAATWHEDPPHPRSPMHLDRVWLGDELLFCRWVRNGQEEDRA